MSHIIKVRLKDLKRRRKLWESRFKFQFSWGIRSWQIKEYLDTLLELDIEIERIEKTYNEDV